MIGKPKVLENGRTVTVRVPISIRKRGGRKIVLTPDGIEHDRTKLRCQRVDNAIVKAVARGFRWREMLEAGRYGTVLEIATDEGINASYVSRLLRLTLLAPDIVDAILDGRQVPELTLATLMRQFPVSWDKQREALCGHDVRS